MGTRQKLQGRTATNCSTPVLGTLGWGAAVLHTASGLTYAASGLTYAVHSSRRRKELPLHRACNTP